MEWKRNAAVGDYFGRRLRQLGLHQNTLASYLNLSPSALSRKLKGEIGFRREEIIAACNFLSIKLEAIPHEVIDIDRDFPAFEVLPELDEHDTMARVIYEALSSLSDHDRKDAYFGIALVLDGMPGQERNVRILRQAAGRT